MKSDDPQRRELSIYGQSIDLQLKDMDAKQRIIAEKLIADVIFHGKLGNLTEQSAVAAKPLQQMHYPQPMGSGVSYAPQYPTQYLHNNYQYPSAPQYPNYSPISRQPNNTHTESATSNFEQQPLSQIQRSGYCGYSNSASNSVSASHSLMSDTQVQSENYGPETELGEFLTLQSNKGNSS